jgi:dTDP-4-amino-4,6-dideoxygalactose transaminase
VTELAALIDAAEGSPRDSAGAPPAMHLPRAPVLGWSSFRGSARPGLHSVDQIEHAAYTTSGRAALYHALRQLDMPPESRVLVATYHCPTMVAPILHANARPHFFPIGRDGLPDLDRITIDPAQAPRAMIVAHYFGLPHSLAEVRNWCDAHSIALIEDCAHCFFGMAGERPVGGWGDFAAASISKFLPVPEAGLLASSRRPVLPLGLAARSLIDQLKGLLDLVETGVHFRRLAGLNELLDPLFKWKNRRNNAPAPASKPPAEDDTDEMIRSCDMGRISQAPLWVSRQLTRSLPRDRIVAQRRRNFDHYALALRDIDGARALCEAPADAVAPYVFPLWVDDAERVYQALRALGAPVFRWDRTWPGTPRLPGDQGPLWSRHVLQMLCHQDLDAHDVARVAAAVRHLLKT